MFNYNPDEVKVLVAGFVHLDGFVDGTFVSITKDMPTYTSRRTTDGTITRLKHNDRNYTVEVTLASASDSNEVLTKLWQLDDISGMGKLPLMVKDSSGSDLFFSATSWIEGIPPLVKSNGIDARTWTFKATQAVINIGGNGEPSSLLEDITNLAIGSLPGLQGII